MAKHRNSGSLVLPSQCFEDLYTFELNGREFNFLAGFMAMKFGKRGRKEDIDDLDSAQTLATVLMTQYKKKRYRLYRKERELKARLYIDISHEMEEDGQRATKDKVESKIFRNKEYKKLQKNLDNTELRIDTLYGVFAMIKSRREDIAYLYSDKGDK